MPIYFPRHLLNLHLLEIEREFLAVFCAAQTRKSALPSPYPFANVVSGRDRLYIGTSAPVDGPESLLECAKDLLKLTLSVDGCAADALGSILTSIFIVVRALGGRRARKLRAVLPERGLKGEKVVETENTLLNSSRVGAERSARNDIARVVPGRCASKSHLSLTLHKTCSTMSSRILSLSARITAQSESLRGTTHLITRLFRLQFRHSGTPLEEDPNDVRVELSQDIHENLKSIEEDVELLKLEVGDLCSTGTAASGGYRRRGSGIRRDSTTGVREDREREQVRLQSQLARLVEELKQCVAPSLLITSPVVSFLQDCVHERVSLKAFLANQYMISARISFRRAQLTAKRAAESAKRQERAALFSALIAAPATENDEPLPIAHIKRNQHHPNKPLSQNDLLINASSDVTVSLRRTHQLMQSELSRSRFAQETLDQSTAALAELGDRYTDLDTLLSNSRSLLRTLVTSQKSDTWYLKTALYLLVATISWLAFRRFIYGPAWWFIYQPLRLVYWFSTSILYAVFGTISSVFSSKHSPSLLSTTTTSTRPSLIIHPSASGRPPRRPDYSNPRMADRGVPVGGGGRGAKRGPGEDAGDGQQPTLESVGKMAEQSSRDSHPYHDPVRDTAVVEDVQGGLANSAGDDEKVVRRGDGTVLQPRGDVPVNPKKKSMVDEPKQRQKRDEL
ncbi:Protein transport protein sec20 [Elasticomyces elasticus]|nr:Protein transport protein sec20 [Elasticomyces elasticus]